MTTLSNRRLTAAAGLLGISLVLWLVLTSRQPSPSRGAVLIPAAIPITIELDHYRLEATTTRPTVAQALAQLDIDYGASAYVSPEPAAPIQPYETIRITNQHPYTLHVGGESIQGESLDIPIAVLLEQHAISLGEFDEIQPGLTSRLRGHQHIHIYRIRHEHTSINEDIPYPTTYQDDPELSYATSLIAQKGQPGTLEKQIKKTYRDDQLIAEEVIHEHIITPPQGAIVKRGTKIIVGQTASGHASWYRSPHGGMSAAALIFGHGTRVRVTSPETGKSVIVTINDSGPYDQRRIIDLNHSAFSALGMPLWQGTGTVVLEELL